MTFQEAKASGRRAQRAKFANKSRWFDLTNPNQVFSVEDFEATDWELEPEEVRVWIPEGGEIFYCNAGDGSTLMYFAEDFLTIYQRNYNSYQTKEEAQQVANYQRVQRKLLALAKALNGDWKPDYHVNESKWFLSIYAPICDGVLSDKPLSVLVDGTDRFPQPVVFRTVEMAEKALAQLTEEEKQILIRGMQ